ncbi:MBL fold metallo-hydrolase [Luteolibacter flavescens]|uniref:MBL fold metallo-hydrolase n=1 Tax=Luteolibacter flavescens TaxID=1859460 RepID=A0ABT3FVR2_9BACT|nr:MBL fold metallo-hydrolase [Luteolibacter flavescens]MCW1887648.1 MBL fold metallo-hydrolase [Luteolibacter flavescens]
MAIRFRVLGGAGRDNALHVEVDSGHVVRRMLFDCGEGCLSALAPSDVQAIDHLFFSHFHMDHVAGFDGFFRMNFARDGENNRIWGPPGTARIMHHRFRSYLWNLHENLGATWRVSDIGEVAVKTWRYELPDAFETAHEEAATVREGALILDEEDFTVEAMTLDHLTASIAYKVTEKTRWNIDPQRLAALGLKPGPWLKSLKDPVALPDDAVVEGRTAGELRAELLVATPGGSIAYLTDFLLDEAAVEKLVPWLKNCGHVICESQYRAADLELARKHYHMTSAQVATLARDAGVGELVLTHVSSRYLPGERAELLEEARAIFPTARFSEEWR